MTMAAPTVGTVSPGHDHLRAGCAADVCDALVIRGDHHGMQRCCLEGLAVRPDDHGDAEDRREGLPGEPGGLVPRWDDPNLLSSIMIRWLTDSEWGGWVCRQRVGCGGGGGVSEQIAMKAHHSCTSFSSVRSQDDDRCNSRS